LDFVGKFVGAGGFNEALGDSLEHNSIEFRVCVKGGGDSIGEQRDNCRRRRTVCRQFIGDINEVVGHGGSMWKGQ
jgi:hypothetical protein